MINAIPWWMKIGLKTVWSRLPVDYSFWKKLGLFRHGLMDKPDYVNKVFAMHWNRVQFARKGRACNAMELGCGDSLASCQVAKAYGVEKYTMVDAGPFASMDIALYKSVARKLRFNGVGVPDIDDCTSVQEMLRHLNAEYLTFGLKSLRAIPAKSVDFVWSQAVLEHVRRAEFPDTMKELRRIMRDDGVASHRVDLRDHLGGALNNLRFPEKAWESPFMSSSGFYTNRIQFSEMLRHMRNAGFDTQVIGVTRWERLPTPREKLAWEFRAVPEEDLLVSGFDVILRPA